MTSSLLSPHITDEAISQIITQLKDAPDVDQGPNLLRLLWSTLSVSIIVVTLRLFTKFQASRRLYWDDGFMLAALIVGITHAVFNTIAINSGFGRHIIYLTLPEISKTVKFGALGLLFGFLSPTLARIAFCGTLMFLTRTDPRIRCWPIWVFIGIQVVVNVTGIIIFYIQCGDDLDAMWDVLKQVNYTAYCWDPRIQTYYGYFMGSVNTVTDLFLTILPAVIIEHTKLSRRSKIGLWCILCLSVLAMVASVVKTYEAKILSQMTDYTYNLCGYVIWSAVELNVVIIAASVPLLRPLFKRKLKGVRGELDERSRWQSHVTPASTVSLPQKYHGRTSEHTQSYSVSSLDAILVPKLRGITVTKEVEVVSESMDAPRIHAALVGLLQGEMANPHLTRR